MNNFRNILAEIFGNGNFGDAIIKEPNFYLNDAL